MCEILIVFISCVLTRLDTFSFEIFSALINFSSVIVLFINDVAKQTRSLLGELNGATDPNYAGSIAFALGCIHRRSFIIIPMNA